MTRTRSRPYLETFRDRPCEACGRADGTTVPAHLNIDCSGKHDGATASLCHECHAIADGRTNAPLAECRKIWLRVARNMMLDRFYLWSEGR